MPTVTVLCLHKITDKNLPSWPGMSIRTFEKLLKYISRNYDVCLPNQIKANPKKKQLILTFDDGFEDFYTNAFPLLDKYNIPAVINVVVDCIKSDYQIWTQQLNDVLDGYAKKGKELEVIISHQRFKYNINNQNAEGIALEVFKKLLPLAKKEREEVISILEKNTPTRIQRTKMMNIEQLKIVADAGIIIGSHSLTHPNLGLEDEAIDLLEYELKESKSQLETIIERSIEIFAYPNGMYSDDSLKIAKESGYKYLLLVDNNLANYDFSDDIKILDRILIYSDNHLKNVFRIKNIHNKFKKWLG